MKHSFRDFDVLRTCLFVDSMYIFQNAGFHRAGLDAICRIIGVTRRGHCTLNDVRLLLLVSNRFPELLLHRTIYSYTYTDILTFLQNKLVVPIQKLYTLARDCQSCTELESKLAGRAVKKTALNAKQAMSIGHFYFKDRYLFCI